MERLEALERNSQRVVGSMSRTVERFLKSQGMNPSLYRYIRKDAESYTFEYLPTGKVRAFRR
jgi:hypothetical protein